MQLITTLENFKVGVNLEELAIVLELKAELTVIVVHYRMKGTKEQRKLK